MARRASARRHAQAVFEIALERDELEGWREDLRKISDVMGDFLFSLYLEAPNIPFKDKEALLGERLEGISQFAMNLVHLLVVKGRVRIAEGIASEYERLVDAYYGIEHAEVTTAIPIDEERREGIAQSLSEKWGKRVVLSTRVDPDIDGGLVIRIGDRLIDGSTKGKLAQLRRDLIGAAR